MKLGRLGVWYSTDKVNAAQAADLMRVIERNGYAAYWYPESRGYESMSLASYLLSNSDRLVVGSSIANIYARDPFTAQRGLVSLNAFHGANQLRDLRRIAFVGRIPHAQPSQLHDASSVGLCVA